MFEERTINGYCEYVFHELTDMRQRIRTMEENADQLSPEDRKTVSDNISILLNELTTLIDSKLNSIVSYCPAIKEKTRGASQWVSEFHAAGRK